MKDIVRAAGLTGFRRLVADCGGDPGAILAAVGLDDAMLSDPDRYIPYRNVLMAFEEAARALGTRDFGLRLAARQDITFLGMLALAIQSAQSVREGLIVAARHMQYHSPSVTIDIGERGKSGIEDFQLRFRIQDCPVIPQATEHAVAHMCKLVGVLSEGRLAPSGIHFRHGRISPRDSYAAHFGQVPRFESGFDGISLRSADSRCRLPRTNIQLQGFVERFLIGAAPPSDLPMDDRVREALRNLMRVQQTGLHDVARIMNMHPRTLQRRLKAAGTSFDALHDDIRREETAALLAQQGVPLAIVARTAGFSDQAALNRACRRWFAATPGAMRKGWKEHAG